MVPQSPKWKEFAARDRRHLVAGAVIRARPALRLGRLACLVLNLGLIVQHHAQQ